MASKNGQKKLNSLGISKALDQQLRLPEGPTLFECGEIRDEGRSQSELY